MQEKQNDFTKNSMAYNIMSLAIPMTIAQLINVLYSLVDRMYIGHLAQNSTLALTGLGITFPIIMLVTAVTNLFGMGGAPLCSIARGRGDDERAEKIIGNSFAMLIICSCILIIIGLVMKKSLLYLFGASDETYPYANEYFSIYIWGSIFVMVGLGMNTFINAQGFAKKGMLTILIGAIINIILDPIFIFGLDLGIKGAAIATVIAQFISASWVLHFLFSDKAIYRIKKSCMKLDFKLRLCHNKQLINSHFYRGVSELPYKLLFAVIYTHLEFRYEVSHTITSHHVHHFHQTRIPDGTLLDYMVQYRKPLFPQFFLYPKKFLPENNPHHKEFHLRPYIQNNANQ